MMKQTWLKSFEMSIILLSSGIVSFGATIRPPLVAASDFADTESVTNIAIRSEVLADARTFTGSIALDATVSNAVEVAFGDADFDGTLAPGVETFTVGWDGGKWFFASTTNRIESAEIVEPGRRSLSFSVQAPAVKKPRILSISTEDAGSAFEALVADAPEWIFSRKWNAVRLTIRGIDAPDESVALRFATDPGALILK